MKIFASVIGLVYSQAGGPPPAPPANDGGAPPGGAAAGGAGAGVGGGTTVTTQAPGTTTPLPIKLNWGGQTTTDPCGSMVEVDESLVNQTCTITYNFGPAPNIFRMYVGGGAFIVPDELGVNRQITGYSGISTDTRVDIVAFWEMAEDANGNLLNDTCGDAAFFDLECESTPDGNALPGVYFMETANDYRMAKGSRYNFQIGGAVVGQTLNIALKDALGNPFACNNFWTNAGDVQLSTAPSCHQNNATGFIDCPNGAVTLNMADTGAYAYASDLINFACTQSLDQAAEPNLWESTIAV